MRPRVLIVGGGISGLSAAWYLNKAGVRATILDKGPRLGGVIRTEHRENCVLELGPDSFLSSKRWALDLIREAGLASEVIGSKDRIRRTFIVKHGRLEALPDGLMMMVPTKIWPMAATRLLSWPTKIRMGLELLRKSTGPRLDRPVSEFIREHYGQEAVDYLAEPLLAGVYGGDPNLLSANSVLTRFVELEAKYGSLGRGAIATRPAQSSRPPESGEGSLFLTLKNGLETLVSALSPSADTLCGEAEALERTPEGLRVRVSGAWIEASEVVIAGPAYIAGDLLRPLDSEAADLLGSIPYNSAVTLSLGYRRKDLGGLPRGSGLLVPKLERKHLKAATWVNNKFDYRAPEDILLLRCFFGAESLEQRDEGLLEWAKSDVKSILGIEAQPLFFQAAKWPHSMAQYTVGHAQRIERLQARMRDLPHIYLAGNFLGGIGIPDCVRSGKEAAETAIRAFQKT